MKIHTRAWIIFLLLIAAFSLLPPWVVGTFCLGAAIAMWGVVRFKKYREEQAMEKEIDLLARTVARAVKEAEENGEAHKDEKVIPLDKAQAEAARLRRILEQEKKKPR